MYVYGYIYIYIIVSVGILCIQGIINVYCNAYTIIYHPINSSIITVKRSFNNQLPTRVTRGLTMSFQVFSQRSEHGSANNISAKSRSPRTKPLGSRPIDLQRKGKTYSGALSNNSNKLQGPVRPKISRCGGETASIPVSSQKAVPANSTNL